MRWLMFRNTVGELAFSSSGKTIICPVWSTTKILSVPSLGDVRKTILLNEMLGNATETVIDMLPGGVREVVLPLEVELLPVLLDVERTVVVRTVELVLLLELSVVFPLPFESTT